MRIVGTALLGLCLVLPMAARAQTNPPPNSDQFLRELQQAERLMRESMAKLLNSMDLLLEAVPRYEAPTFNENGDIIIRRKRPDRGPTLRTGGEDGMIDG